MGEHQMKTLVGIAQLACIIGGFVALFQGHWMWLIVGWVAAGILGYLGNQLVRAQDGISESGKQAVDTFPQIVAHLRAGNFESAAKLSRGAASGFAIGKDTELLAVARQFEAAALIASGDLNSAQTRLNQVDAAIRPLATARSGATPQPVAELLEVQEFMRHELSRGVPLSGTFVERFLAHFD